jgi:cellulose synthase/poly-beta-1,6-N-acetylglucosamine synthase-like glycosyltransferase
MYLNPFAVWGAAWSYYAFLYYRYFRALRGFDEAHKEIESARNIDWRRKAEVFSSEHGKELPRFLTIVPAYDCMATIRKTIQTIAYSDYPADRFNIYVLTESKEAARAERKRERIVNVAYDLLTSQELPSDGYQEAEPLIRFILDNHFRDISPELSHLLTEKILKGRLDRNTVERIVGAAIADLRIADALQGKLVDGKMAQYADYAKRIIEDYSSILGFESRQDYTDPESFSQLAKELVRCADSEKQLSLREIGRKAIKDDRPEGLDVRLFNALSSPSETERYIGERLREARTQFIGMGDGFRDLLEEAYDETFVTTVSEAEKEKDRLNAQYPGLVEHLVLEEHPGFKPGAMNLFLERVDGSIKDPDNSHVVVFDGDSLPARWSLPLLAYSIISSEEKNPVFQIYVSAMGNYHHTRGRFIRGRTIELIPLFQTIGMTGRVRGMSVPHKEPDMDGGRGFSIPYNLIKRFGGWDIRTVCEDSRLLTVRVGLMDERTKYSKYLPAFNLEETPTSISVYLKQQKRWVKGIDDVIEIIKAPISDMLLSSDLTQKEKPGFAGRMKLNARKARLAFTDGLRYLYWGLLPFGLASYFLAEFLSPLSGPTRIYMNMAAGVLFTYGWFRHYCSLKSLEAYTPGGFNKSDKIKLTLLGPLAPLYSIPVTGYMISHYLSKLNPRRVAEWVVTEKTGWDKTTYKERHWQAEEKKKKPEGLAFHLDTLSLVIITLTILYFVLVMFPLVISGAIWAVK